MWINTPNSVCNDPANIAPHIGVQDFLDIADMKLEDFDGKNIADIAGGAWLLSLYIQNKATPAHVVLIDIDLQKKSFEQIVERARNTFEKFSHAPAGLPKFELELADISSQLEKVFDPKNPLNSSDLSLQKEKKEKFITHIKDKMDKLKESAELLNKYLSHEYKGLELNDSSGEHIIWIESNSQDIVFINHILCKLPDIYFQILQEADRILKPDGEIIIVDYPHYEPESGHWDYFRKLCDEKRVITKESEDSMCIKLKKWAYSIMQ